MEKFYIYILQSEKTNRYYCGQTHDLQDRLTRHNSGRSKSTARERPWKLIRTFIFDSRSEAMLLEKKIKKRGIKRYLEDLKDG